MPAGEARRGAAGGIGSDGQPEADPRAVDQIALGPESTPDTAETSGQRIRHTIGMSEDRHPRLVAHSATLSLCAKRRVNIPCSASISWRVRAITEA